MNALPIEPTERDRERFRDLTKAMQFGLEYDRHGDDYKYDLTDLMFRLWWSVERERQLLQNLNQSQGVKISELLARAEKAEAELAKLRTAPNEIGLGQGEFVIWPVQINGVHGLAFVKTDDPKAVGTSHAEPEDGQIEIGAGDSAIYFGNAESAMVLAERLQYVISLMAGSDAAPVPAVADKRVDELAMLIRRLVRRLNQELPHNDIGEAAMDYLARNGISGEILRGWAAPAVPEEWLKCWLIERPASSEWPAIWLTLTTDGRRWVSDGGTMYATGGDWYFTTAASEALQFAEKESADEYVRHNKIKGVVVTEHIFDNRALLQSTPQSEVRHD